ncbi:unnamed protein product [Arctia plantaginis]|uniref:Uncharacterized protein n=1 Tax=Arctia plantaginis TaxID=874455 RepID=A0A8S0ZTB2_ARCPL|nr:unnamed protein product [Arctia plantaginis]
MMAPPKSFKSAVSLLLLMIKLTAQVSASTQFASHVSVHTPARSFTHGVGDPLPLLGVRNYNRQITLRMPTQSRGYPRVKPARPFRNEDLANNRHNALKVSPWMYNNYMDVAIPILPPSPYKVDSPDPESLWPEGLLVPSLHTQRFASNRRSEVLSDSEDPYLLEGSEAIAAVEKACVHGLYFHDIPHIKSLFANQALRVKNNLKPHRIASIRHSWPYNRP